MKESNSLFYLNYERFDRKGICPVCGGKKKIGLRWSVYYLFGFHYFAKCKSCQIEVFNMWVPVLIHSISLILYLIIGSILIKLIELKSFYPKNNLALILLLLAIPMIIIFVIIEFLIPILMMKPQFVEKTLDKQLVQKAEIQTKHRTKKRKS